MKRFSLHLAFLFLLLTSLVSATYATQITIAASAQPNMRPAGLPAIRSGTATATNGSTGLTLVTAIPSNWVGIGGYIIELAGTNYYVGNTTSVTGITLAANYSGSTGTVSYRIFPFVLLRVYALNTFQPNGASYIVQQGAPGSGNWYKQVGVSIINDGANSTAYIPQMTLDATTDAVNPNTQNARYFAGFYRIEGGMIAPFLCFEQFRLPATTTPTSWSAICTFNQATTQPNDPTTYYTARQLDDRWRACSQGQSYYFAASGVRLSCLTYGSGLSLDVNTGILTATAASPLLGAREAVNVKRDHSCAGDGVTNDTACIVAAITAAQAAGKELYFPAGTYLTDPITQSLSNLVVIGDSYKSSILKARNANTPIINLTTANSAVDLVIQDLGFVGQGPTSGSSGHCIVINDVDVSGSGLAQATLRNVHISQCGGKGLYVPRMFSTLLDSVVVDQVGGNGFELHGSNTTTLLRTYVKTLSGANTVAYRIYAGTPTLIGANGIDSCPNGGCDWAVLGRTVADDGVESYVRLNCTNCNIEDFRNRGVYFKYYSSGNFFNTTFYAPTSGTVTAIKYDFVDETIQGIFDGQSSIVTQGASWTNGYPIHSNANPFHSFSVTTAPYNTFWNGTDPQIMPQWGYSFESGIGQYFSRSTGLAADKLKIGGGGIPTGYQSYFRSTSIGNIGLAVTQAVGQTARPFIVENATSSVILGVNTDGSMAANAGGALAFTVKDTSGNALLRAARANAWADSTASSFVQLGGSAESGWISGLNAATLPRLGVTATATQITDTDTGSAPAPGSNLLSLYKTTSGNVALQIKAATAGQTGDLLSVHNGTAVQFRLDANAVPILTAAAGGGTRVVCVDNNGAINTFGCSGGGGSGITSIAASTGGAQTGPALSILPASTGTDFTITGNANTITVAIPTASASNRGLLSASDFAVFNAKIAGTIATSQIAVGASANTIGGSSNLTAGGGSVISTGAANTTVGFSQSNSSSGNVAQSVFSLTNNASGQATFGLNSSGFTTSGLFAANQAFINADTGLTTLLFRLNDSGTSSFRFGISTSQVARLDETGLSIGTVAPSTKIDVAATGLAAGFAGIRFRNISNATSPDTGITSGYLGVDASGYVKVITTPGGMPDPGANGVVVRTALNTTTARTITGTANEITVADGNGVSGNPTLSLSSTFSVAGKTSTAPMKTGTAAPGTCNVGEFFFDTDATAGQNTYACTATDTWTLQGDAGGAGTSAWSSITNPTANESLSMAAYTTAFTWGNATGASTNMFSLADGASNTGTGYVFSVNTASSSAAKPVRFTAGGTSNGVEMNTSGIFAALGTGGVSGAAIVGANTVANAVLDADLAAIGNNSTDGILTRTGVGTVSARTITGTANQITVSNGDGVSGNPTLSTPQNIHTAATPQFAGLGLGEVAPAAGLELTGKTISTDATNTVGAADMNFSVTKNDTNTRVFHGLNLLATLNAGGSNANTTVNVATIDTTNTAVTGLTVNLLNVKYGGANKFIVDSGGNATFGGAISVTSCTGCGNFVATLTSSNYSVITTDTLVIVNASGGARTATMFTASGNTGKVVEVCKSSADTSTNNVTVSATSSYTLSSPGQCQRLVSDGTNWLQQ